MPKVLGIIKFRNVKWPLKTKHKNKRGYTRPPLRRFRDLIFCKYERVFLSSRSKHVWFA